MSPSSPVLRRALPIWFSLMLLPLGAASTSSPVMAEVIVRGDTLHAVTDAVQSLGGTVNASLQVINGVDASIPATQLERLASARGVLAVTPDARVSLHGQDDYDPREDPNALRSVAHSIKADRAWRAGHTGEGVGIAMIDTGVVDVPGLDLPGQIIHGPDLSFESQGDNVRHLDAYGHGTHMASIMVGNDGVDPARHKRHPDAFLGIAPESHLISVKVADAHGATDVSQVIAAIDWVVQHRDDPGLNIRVLNMSFGVHAQQSHVIDPLAHAAQVAWDAGIVVVAAAGNDGDERVGVTSPAHHPRILAVGAIDTNESRRRADWTPLSFTARAGDDGRVPDLLAPGSSIVGLASPGSFLDQAHGSTARVGDRGFRGTGTSQAAAVTSGAVALILQANPSWSPDQVKAHLIEHSPRLKPKHGFDGSTGTRGLKLRTLEGGDAAPHGGQDVPASVGGGSIEATRGGFNPVLDGVALQGEIDIFGMPIDTVALAAAQDAHSAWTDGGTWNGTQWTGTQWNGTQWNGTQWNGTQWNGTQWNAQTWAGTQWSGTQWQGTQWQELRWNGNQWSGTQWSGTQWSGSQWSGSQWSGTVWSGTVWG